MKEHNVIFGMLIAEKALGGIIGLIRLPSSYAEFLKTQFGEE